MPIPRRRIIRPALSNNSTSTVSRLQKLRAQLEHARKAQARWQTRLKRALTMLEKHQRAVARLERRLSQLEIT